MTLGFRRNSRLNYHLTETQPLLQAFYQPPVIKQSTSATAFVLSICTQQLALRFRSLCKFQIHHTFHDFTTDMNLGDANLRFVNSKQMNALDEVFVFDATNISQRHS